MQTATQTAAQTAAKEKQAAIVRILTPYLAAYQYNKMSEASLVVYARALSGLDLGNLEAAMLKLLRVSRFFPTVAEIIEAAESIRQYAAGKALPTADEAWQEAMGLVRKCHVYKPWKFSCPAVETAVKRFGKMELCSLAEGDVNTARAQFMRIYNSVLGVAQDKEHNKQALASLPEPVRKLLLPAKEVSE